MPRRHCAWFLVLTSACGSDSPESRDLGSLADPKAAARETPGSGTGDRGGAAPNAVAPTAVPSDTNEGNLPGQFAGAGMQEGATPEAGSASGADAGAVEPTRDAGERCPARGLVSYTLARAAAPTPEEQTAYARIGAAMDRALEFYNCYTNLELTLRVSFVPGVATADGNVNGSLRFGSPDTMNPITAMHEIGHAAGVGGPRFQALVVGGVYTGPSATAVLRDVTADPAAELHGDTQHFWPYGLNYTSEVSSDEDLIRHCLIVGAMQADFAP